MSAVAATDVRRDIERCHSQEPSLCPADGCGRLLKSNRAMCRDCWSRVPVELKNLVRKAARGGWDEWVDAMCHAVHASEIAP